MHKSKLITILKTLDKKEIKRLGEFVSSPFYNKNENIRTLYFELIKQYPEFSEKKILIEDIFKKVFPGIKYDYFKISNLNSDLYQIVKNFLSIKSFESDKIMSNISLLRELDSKNLDLLYTQTEKEVKNDLSKKVIKDEHFYLLNYFLDNQNSNHYKFHKSHLELDIIQKEFDSFHQYYIVTLLKLYTKMLYNKNHGQVNYNMEMFDEIWGYVKDKEIEDNLLYSIYKNIISLELNKEERDFIKLRKLKNKFINEISSEEIYNILIFMNSFIAYRLNKFGDEAYYKDRFEVIKELVEREFITPAQIAYPDYTYFFIAASTVGEFEWAENFKENFKNGIVPPDEIENAVNFCNAYLNYRKKQFGKALEYFAKTNFKLFFLKVTVKSITIRILYETNMHEEALAAIDSFRHYLKSEKLILEEQKNAHYEFLKYTTELFKLKNNDLKDNWELKELKRKISEMDNSAFGVKSWLIKKIEEFG